MGKMINSSQESQRQPSPYPDFECEDPYARHYHNKGGVIVAYDNQGRIREMKNAYGDFVYFTQFEQNENDICDTKKGCEMNCLTEQIVVNTSNNSPY